MSDLKSRGTKAFFWDFIGKFAKNGISFIVMIILARLLEPSDFGHIAMIMVVVALTQIFADVGLASALIQRRHLKIIHYSSVFYFNLFSATLLSLALYFSAPLIGNFYQCSDLTPITQVMSVAFIIDALASVQNAALKKELNYALMTQSNLLSALVSGILGILFAYLSYGVWSLVIQILSQKLLYTLLVWIRSSWKPSPLFSVKALVQLWGFGFRIFLSNILETLFSRLDYLLIGKLFSPSILGFFQQATALNSIVVQYSSGSLMAVLFPILSKVQKDLLLFQNIVRKTYGIIVFIVFLLMGALYIGSDELILLLFGPKWEPTVHYFKILVLSGFAYPISALLVNILSSRGKSKAFLKLEIYKKIIFSLNFINLYFNGIILFLYGLIAASILGVLLNIYVAAKEINFSVGTFIQPAILHAVITFLAVAGVVWWNPHPFNSMVCGLILQEIIFICLYFSLSFLTKSTALRYTFDQINPIIQTISKKIRKNNS